MRGNSNDTEKIRVKKYFAGHFLNKVFLVYLMITIFSSIALLYILSENLQTLKYNETLKMSNQILTTVSSFMRNKFDAEKSIFQRFIGTTEKWDEVTKALMRDAEAENIDGQEEVRQDFSKIAYSIDGQFSGIYAYSNENGNILQLGNNMNSSDYYYFETLTDSIQENKIPCRLVTSRGNHLNNMFSVFLIDVINHPKDYTKDIGLIGISFNARNIRQSCQEFDPYMKGQIYILDGNGKIVYDSKAEYLEEKIPFERLENKNTKFMLGDRIYNSIYNEHHEYYVVNLIPMEEIRQDVAILQESIFRIMIIVILLSLVLTFFSTRYFSARLRTIKLTIDQVKNGKLSGFHEEKQVRDEVGYIYRELIDMCATLEEYINKEYVYQLRQKEMELYALQAQINPHFLYNTLESIRMNLYVKGEKEASKMIYILSEMFRNIMKKGAVVSVREEIDYVNSYLELYRFRYGIRMKYEVEAEDVACSYATIKHILQPIIENALIHGIQDSGTASEPASILIKACQEGEDIIFTVEDDGCGITEARLTEIRSKLAGDDMFQESVGIYNVNNRLRIVYGENYRLQIESREGAGTRVTVRIIAMRKKELEDYVRGLNC